MKLSELFEGKTEKTVWVIAHTGDKIILGKRAPTTRNPNQWNFFGGHVDDGESPEEAAVRELEEETGLSVDTSILKKVATIGSATYYSAKIFGGLKTSKEISAIKSYKLTDLPNNLHSKTQTFFSNLDALL